MTVMLQRGSDTLTKPIVVGGNGGSGTRLVAKILLCSGIFLGHDLNRSQDNLSFTYLFKHPTRYAKNVNRPESEFGKLFALHEKLLLRHSRLSLPELRLVLIAGRDHVRGPYYGGRWVWERLKKILFPSNLITSVKSWGWKEPHTMFFLYGLSAYYPDAKFILVLRDGLDMVFSRNRQQFRYWASAYGLDPNEDSEVNRFEFWYRSNKNAIRVGNKYMGQNFMSIKLEDLCKNPERNIGRLVQFAEAKIDSVPSNVWSMPMLPSSYGRYQSFDTRWINVDVRRKAAEIGYVH